MNWKNISVRDVIALMLVASFIAMSFLLVFAKVPESDVFKMFAGAIITIGFATIVGFYFGSSSGSKAKDEALHITPPKEPVP